MMKYIACIGVAAVMVLNWVQPPNSGPWNPDVYQKRHVYAGLQAACDSRATDCGEAQILLTDGRVFDLKNASRAGEPQRSQWSHITTISHILAENRHTGEKIVIDMSEPLDYIEKVAL